MAPLADRWVAAAFFVYGLAVVIPLLLSTPASSPDDPFAARLGPGTTTNLARSVASLYYDDGFYYLGIARNLARGDGPPSTAKIPPTATTPCGSCSSFSWLG